MHPQEEFQMSNIQFQIFGILIANIDLAVKIPFERCLCVSVNVFSLDGLFFVELFFRFGQSQFSLDKLLGSIH
jgi:hypothetical protein